MSNERSLLARLTTRLPSAAPHVRVGIGDDCAVTEGRPAWLRLCTTDLLVEDVHFRRQDIRPETLGKKSLAVNLSDIAAMGGLPLDAYVSLAIPKDFTDDALEALYEGLGAHARAHNVVILGGDTTRSLGPLIINIAVVGEVPEGEVLLRSGAREGDRIFVSGPLGDAAAGLHALFAAHNDDLAHRLTKRHQAPRPRLTLGRALAATGQVHAAIDLSDGLSTDLGHILHRSAVGAIVNAGAIPLSDDLQSYGAREGLDTIRLALDGGEDYELLICGDASLGEHFAELSDIGEIVASKEPLGLIRHPDGTTEPLTSQGWDPFSKEI